MREAIDFEWNKVWTTDDFDQMGWHDATLHGVGFDPDTYRVALDIDYIFEWIDPEYKGGYFKFYVAPATLIFRNIHKFEFDMGEPYRTLQIDSVERNEPQKPPNSEYIEEDIEWQWKIDFEVGFLSFHSVGYEQYIRCEPVLTNQQTLSLQDRGGINIEFPTLDES